MAEYKYVGTDVLWKRMTPAQREQALRLIAKMEREPRVLLRDKDGAMIGMPESVYKEHLKLKAESKEKDES